MALAEQAADRGAGVAAAGVEMVTAVAAAASGAAEATVAAGMGQGTMAVDLMAAEVRVVEMTAVAVGEVVEREPAREARRVA